MFEELAKTLTAQKNKSAMNESKNKVIETSKLEPTVMVSNKKINDEKMKAKFLYVNKCILQQYILTKEALLLSPINSAIHIINCTLSKFNESDLDKSNIVNSILTIRN